jgi:hypothetical protein
MSADAPPYPNRENASCAAARRPSPARVQLQFGGEFDKLTGLQPDDLLAGPVRHRATVCVSRRPHARSLRSTTSASNFSVSQYRVREQRLPSTQPSRARRSATPLTSSRNSRAEFGRGPRSASAAARSRAQRTPGHLASSAGGALAAETLGHCHADTSAGANHSNCLLRHVSLPNVVVLSRYALVGGPRSTLSRRNTCHL